MVHVNHGIGRYLGLTTIALGGDDEEPGEFLQLEYADKATLYVPVAQLHLIARYTGVSAEEAPLHRLGSGQWDKARRKAAEQVRDTAAELLNLYARRAAREGFAFRFQPHDYEAFAASFGFDETPDQHAAIHAVIQDMVSPRPMDRLVCGDVGFGKTEVALRAAFVAVNGGKQVAILAPTTLLAEQHHQNIADRFGKWPIKVAELSRFRSPKEVKAALDGLDDGTVDIVVGTHKLLSSRRQVQAPRPARDRRGAPLRRAPQGADEGAARRGRRAHADRDADPAHARHGARGPARPLGDRDRAASGAWRSRPSCAARARARSARPCCASSSAAARSTSCTTTCRRSSTGARRCRRWCPRRASPSPTARCRSASSSA